MLTALLLTAAAAAAPPTPEAAAASGLAPDPRVLLEEARDQLQRCEPRQALPLLERVAQLRRGDPAPWVYLTGAYILLEADREDGPWEEMASRARREAARRAEAMDGEATARDHFWAGQAYGLLAVEHGERGAWMKAARLGKKMRAAGRRALQDDPDLTDALVLTGLYDYLAAELPAYVKLFRFLLFLPGGDEEEGIAALEKAARGGTLAAHQAGVILQEILLHEDRAEEAVDIGRIVLERRPRDAPSHLRLAKALARAGKYREAADRVRPVTEREAGLYCLREDESWEAGLLAGLALLRAGEAETARGILDTLERGEDRPAGVPKALAVLAALGRAAAFDRLGSREEATAICRAALVQLDGESARTRLTSCLEAPIEPDAIPWWF